jgi:hypothetical protein
MNKKLLTIVGVAAVIGIGYYAWKSSKPKEQTNGGSKPPKTCAADEVEQQVYCIAAPCPTMCVKKPKCAADEYEENGVCFKKMHQPALGLGDEPTGNGDYEAGTYEPMGDSRGRGFIGGTGSFFNPKRGRNQDTSF